MTAPASVLNPKSMILQAVDTANDEVLSKPLLDRDHGQIGSADDTGSDIAIIGQLRAGNEEIIGVLLARYRAVVQSICYRILRDEAEAQDVTQEVFLSVLYKSDSFDSTRGNVRSWVIQIAYHRAIDRRRYLLSRRHYQNPPLDSLTVEQPLSVHPSRSYESTLEDQFGKKAIEKARKTLTAPQAETLEQYFLYGYSLDEIAPRLNQSVGNVRNHYYRALEKLRKGLLAVEGSNK